MSKVVKLRPTTQHETDSYPWLAEYPADIDWYAELPVKPLFTLLDEAVETYGDYPFMDFLGRKSTYGEAGPIVEQTARAFQELGVGKGVKVGLLLPNCPYFVICFFAILKAGGTAVLYNPLLATNEIARQIEDSETDFMVTVDMRQVYSKIADIVTESRLKKIIVCGLGQALPWSKRLLFTLLKSAERVRVPRDDKHIAFELFLRNLGKFDSPEIDPQADMAALLYTGGTTGAPKGVCLSHYNLYANTLQSTLGLPSAQRGKERVLAIVPFFHAFGMTAVLNTSIALGAEIIILPSFDPGEVLKTIHKMRPTMFLGVPTIFAAIVNHPKADQYDLSSLRLCTCGGDALSLDLKQSFQRLVGCEIVQGYGLTECSPVVTAGSPLGMEKPNSIGVPLPGTVVGILQLEHNQTPLGPSLKGEICVRGPQVMMQYFNRPDDTAEVLHDGWLHTGDIGYFDEDGYFYLVDRLKDLIITGGYNVYPSVVEAALIEHPNIDDVAVVGLPHPHWGQEVTAFVVAARHNGVSQEDLHDFLKGKLSSYELPKSVRFLDELPKSKIGKVKKAMLRQNYETEQQT